MPKKFKSPRIYLKADPIYKDKLVSQFINYVMIQGKKSVAQRIFFDSMKIIEKRSPEVEAIEIFKTAINNVKPLIEVRSRRVGGATYQVPREIEKKRQITLALRWLLGAARERKGKPMAQKLADELLDAYKKQGKAIAQRENVHRMAEANKAFAHFAW